MGTIGFGHAFPLVAPLATAMACTVLCASAAAQAVGAQTACDCLSSGHDSTPDAAFAVAVAAQNSTGASGQVEYADTGESRHRQIRPFGSGTNGAIRYIRSNVEVSTWRNLPGLQEAGRYRAELSEISARWWFSAGRTDVGLGMGSVVLTTPPVSVGAAADTANSGAALAASPAVSVGIRRRTSAASTVYADATRSRSMGVNGVDSYSGKVGVEWKSAESQWSLAYSGLGMRLSPESRMTLSLRKGGLGIYMRSRF